ncbi:MAG: hypothetical protein VYD10_05630 [Actinomycetota bacterium]|nr:hypothetical protein [Actinomycetota bacterium]
MKDGEENADNSAEVTDQNDDGFTVVRKNGKKRAEMNEGERNQEWSKEKKESKSGTRGIDSPGAIFRIKQLEGENEYKISKFSHTQIQSTISAWVDVCDVKEVRTNRKTNEVTVKIDATSMKGQKTIEELNTNKKLTTKRGNLVLSIEKLNNLTRRIIFLPKIENKTEDIKKDIESRNPLRIRKLVRLGSTKAVLLTFDSEPPSAVETVNGNKPLHVYVPNKQTCYKCQEKGHVAANCPEELPKCSNCAEKGHDHRNCNAVAQKCTACGGPHRASQCPIEEEKKEERKKKITKENRVTNQNFWVKRRIQNEQAVLIKSQKTETETINTNTARSIEETSKRTMLAIMSLVMKLSNAGNENQNTIEMALNACQNLNLDEAIAKIENIKLAPENQPDKRRLRQKRKNGKQTKNDESPDPETDSSSDELSPNTSAHLSALRYLRADIENQSLESAILSQMETTGIQIENQITQNTSGYTCL